MKHLTLVALVFSMLVAVAVSGCVVRDHYYDGPAIDALKRAALSTLKAFFAAL